MSRAACLPALVPRGPVARIVVGCVCLCLLFWLGREIAVRSALGRAASLARRLGVTSRDALPEAARPNEQATDPLSWLLSPESPAGDEAAAVPVPASPGHAARSAGQALAPPPAPVVTLRGNVVLSLAERGAVPRGVLRPASGDMPAGIEIMDGAGLGIGWFPGDRLIMVGGVSVVDRAQVIRAVLQERAQRAPVIAATLARLTREGVVTYRVLVEQPYVSAEVAEPPAPPAPAPEAPEP